MNSPGTPVLLNKQYCLPKCQMIARQACKTFFLGGGSPILADQTKSQNGM